MFDWRNWVRGLIGAVIGGGANAVTVLIIDPLKFNLQEGWKNLLSFTFISALVSAALYLKQNPVPKEEDIVENVETTIVKKDEVTQ